MPDREKVISGLEHCGFTEKRGCDGCPYEDECTDFGCDAGHGSVCTDALALLKEQEPVEPHWSCPTVYMNGTGKIEMMCGNCGVSIPLGKPNYCPWCGRKVKWDEGD